MISDAFFDMLSKKDVEYKKNFSLAKYSFSRIGGEAAALILPSNEQKLIDSIKTACDLKIPYKIVGRMSNILACDERYEGALISTRRLSSLKISNSSIEIGCGTFMPSAIRFLAQRGISVAEPLSGIPATLGGMVYSNAGAFGAEISDFLIDARVFSAHDFSIRTVSKSELRFDYRKSALRDYQYVLLSARLAFNESPKEVIAEKISLYKKKRISTQPYEYPSLGSVFKRVGNHSAAYFIDRCGLKGLQVGGAMVSEKHAGFIVNVGGASASDFKELIALIKEEVFSEFGILLSEEIEFLEN